MFYINFSLNNQMQIYFIMESKQDAYHNSFISIQQLSDHHAPEGNIIVASILQDMICISRQIERKFSQHTLYTV